jgi:uncharacterized protein (UPF0548 family)
MIFRLTKPTSNDVSRFLKARGSDEFSYAEVGATGAVLPTGYNIDHNRICLGIGAEVYARAKAAVRAWRMFDLGWVDLISPCTPIEIGRAVCIVVRHFGFYSMSAARIVYVIDDDTNADRFGFAYGTLTEHAESGEERFSVEFNSETGEVWYDLLAFSRPASRPARVGYPLSRYLQKRFAADSKLAMLRAVIEEPAASKTEPFMVK